VLDRDEKYWAPGQPYLERITWKITPDVSGRATALETGAAQYGGRNPLTFADADRLAKLPNLVVSREGYNGYTAWLWLEPNLRDPLLGKLEVRQAISHAIDRDVLSRRSGTGMRCPRRGPSRRS
jgi:peptide/nickel transport system substrate-binding protein